MSHTNYNAMSKQNQTPANEKPKTNVALENLDLDQVQEPATVNVPEPTPMADEPKIEFGFVSDCAKLNVRKEPDVKAEVVCVIENNSEVFIDLIESTEDFYKVTGESGFEGYCMKKYITIE